MEKELINLMKELVSQKGQELKTIEVLEYVFRDGSTGRSGFILNRQYVGRVIGGHQGNGFNGFNGRYYQKKYSLRKINAKQLNKEIEDGYYISEYTGKVLVKVIERIEL